MYGPVKSVGGEGDKLTREERQLCAALIALLLFVLVLVVAGIAKISQVGAFWFFNQSPSA